VISGICDFAYVHALKGKWLELSTPNLMLILYGRISPSINPEVKISKVKVMGL